MSDSVCTRAGSSGLHSLMRGCIVHACHLHLARRVPNLAAFRSPWQPMAARRFEHHLIPVEPPVAASGFTEYGSHSRPGRCDDPGCLVPGPGRDGSWSERETWSRPLEISPANFTGDRQAQARRRHGFFCLSAAAAAADDNDDEQAASSKSFRVD